MLRFLIAFALLSILFISTPVAHATSPPGLPILYFSSQGGPYLAGQQTTIPFIVRNRGSDMVSGLLLNVKAGQGWEIFGGAVNVGNLNVGEQRSFSIQAVVGNPSYPYVAFAASSNDHVTVDFPTAVAVAERVTANMIANPGEPITSLLNIATQWGAYTVDQIGDILFPTQQAGITDTTGLPQILQGYYVKSFLQSNSNLGQLMSSLSSQLGKIVSDASSIQSSTNQPYSFSVSFGLTTVTYTINLYSFLTWQIPLSQWTLGLISDRSVADLIAWAINHFAGINVSANDLLQLANLIANINSGSLPGYISDLSSFSQLISTVLSSNEPDLSSLSAVLNSVGQILGELSSAAGVVSSLTGAIQGLISWMRNFVQQLYQIFNSLINWISNNIPIVGQALNTAISWLRDTINPVLNGLISLFDSGNQAQPSAQSANSGLGPMSASVSQSSNTAWSALSARLDQVAGQTRQNFNDFCLKYEPASANIKKITSWIGTAAFYISGATAGTLTPAVMATFGGMTMLENGIDVGCSLSLTGTSDPVQIISVGYGAAMMLGGLFPTEEAQFHGIANALNGIDTAVSVATQLQNVFASSGFDLSGVSTIISNYQVAGSQGMAAYQSSTPDYVGAVNAISSVTTVPSLDAVNLVLQDVQPCASVMKQFSAYGQEGMVAPDLQNQIQGCQETGQSVISGISSGQYSAISQAAALPALASQLSSAVEARHQEFLIAKNALARLDSATTSLEGCAFLWVKPDPNTVAQARQALQSAQSQFFAGKYSDAASTANEATISDAGRAGQACTADSLQAKLEIGGLAAGAIILFSGFAYLKRQRFRTRSSKSTSDRAGTEDNRRHR